MTDPASELIDKVLDDIKHQTIVSVADMVDYLLDIRNASLTTEQELQRILDDNALQPCGCPNEEV